MILCLYSMPLLQLRPVLSDIRVGKNREDNIRGKRYLSLNKEEIHFEKNNNIRECSSFTSHHRFELESKSKTLLSSLSFFPRLHLPAQDSASDFAHFFLLLGY
jgi:hypothetical protein